MGGAVLHKTREDLSRDPGVCGEVGQNDDRKVSGWSQWDGKCPMDVTSSCDPLRSAVKLLNLPTFSNPVPGQNHSDTFKAKGTTGS